MYETPTDLKNEAEVMDLICEKWLSNAYKLPISYGVDYGLVSKSSGRMNCFIEIKCRTNLSNTYPTFFVAVKKVQTAHSLHEATGLETFIVVRWADMIGYERLLNLSFPQPMVTLGGRTDRGDEADVEPMYHIPVENFYRLDNGQ